VIAPVPAPPIAAPIAYEYLLPSQLVLRWHKKQLVHQIRRMLAANIGLIRTKPWVVRRG
jgi:hypothetical protein